MTWIMRDIKGLITIEVKANSMDEAFEKARKINKDIVSAQPK